MPLDAPAEKDDWVTAPAAKAEKDDWITAPAAKQTAGDMNPAMTEFPTYAASASSEPAPGNAAVERVGKVAKDAFLNTQLSMKPDMEEAINNGGPIGRYITTPAIHAMDVARGAGNAGMAALSQAAMEVFGEKGGRDALALLSVLPMAGGERMSPNVAAPAEVTPRPQFVSERMAPDVTGLDPRNAAQALITHDITENPVIPGRAADFGTANQSLAEIGRAPDIDTAIEAAGRAAQAPSGRAMTEWMQPLSKVVTPPEEPVLTGDVLPPEPAPIGRPQTMTEYLKAGGNAVDATPAEAPVPQSVGAAASREGTAPELMLPETPAQRATALQKMVNQSAEDRVMPGGRDDAVYIPGVERPEAMRDFSHAPEGQESSALAHKTLYNTDSNYHDQFDAQVKKNNDIMVDRLGNLMGDANSRDAAMNAAKELMPGPVGLFDEQRPVSAQPVADRINEILAGPAGKRGAVRTQLSNILDNLKDTNGDLEEMPSMLKGIRDDITDKLYDKSPTTEGNAARTARNQLQDVLGVVDETIAKGLPGTKYQDYLSNLSDALGAVTKQDYLQSFLTGPKKLTDLAGNLVFNKVQRLLEDIQKHHADRTGGAKELSMDEINQIEAVRNELAAKDLLDRRAAVRGSPTAQLTNSSGILGSGPLGAGVKGAAEVALHAGLAPLTGGIGNAALAGYRFILKPAMDAAKAQQTAAALAATKQRLLDTTPRLEEGISDASAQQTLNRMGIGHSP